MLGIGMVSDIDCVLYYVSHGWTQSLCTVCHSSYTITILPMFISSHLSLANVCDIHVAHVVCQHVACSDVAMPGVKLHASTANDLLDLSNGRSGFRSVGGMLVGHKESQVSATSPDGTTTITTSSKSQYSTKEAAIFIPKRPWIWLRIDAC